MNQKYQIFLIKKFEPLEIDFDFRNNWHFEDNFDLN